MIEEGARLLAKPLPPAWLVEESTIDEVAHSQEHFRELRKMAGIGGEDKPWNSVIGNPATHGVQLEGHSSSIAMLHDDAGNRSAWFQLNQTTIAMLRSLVCGSTRNARHYEKAAAEATTAA